MNRLVQGAIAVASACTLVAPALALDIPKLSNADHRVRYASYNPSDVIQLDAMIGVATVIVLEPDEQYEFHVFGDSDAYEFTHHRNHLFFKPIADQADSNLIVITNKRNYTFRVSYSNDRSARALYKLVLRYPDTQAKEARKIARAQKLQTALSDTGPINWQAYSKSGDMALAPVHAWDNGSQTWMQFAPGAEIPAIYRVTPDGQEVMTNYHMADNRTVVLHRVASRWFLRLGNQVAAIHNTAHGQVPVKTPTGTASVRVQRIVQGEQAPVPSQTPQTKTAQIAASSNAQTVPQSKRDGLGLEQFWEQDGHTWMVFTTADLPAVRALDDDGNLHDLPVSIQPDNTLVVKGTAAQWLLERGQTQHIVSAKEYADDQHH